MASDHLLSYGHGAIYCQKAFELLEMIGWDRADTVLPHLVPTIVYGTREDLLPYTRPFVRALAGTDVAALATLGVDAGWRDDGTLLATLLGNDRKAIVPAVVVALRDGSGVDGVLDVVVQTVGERMMRYDLAGERDLLDDFGWLDITHGLTYAHAARWHHRQSPGADTVRLAMFTAFLAQWTGRHEWHTKVGERDVGRMFEGTVLEAGEALQREALLDNAVCVHRLRPRHQDGPGSGPRGSQERLDAAAAGRRSPAGLAPIGTIRGRQRGQIHRVPVWTGTPRRLSARFRVLSRGKFCELSRNRKGPRASCRKSGTSRIHRALLAASFRPSRSTA